MSSFLRYYRGLARYAYLGIDNRSYLVKPRKILRSRKESRKLSELIVANFSSEVVRPNKSTR